MFCVPVASDDTDAASHRLKMPTREVVPVEDWPTWSDSISDMNAVRQTNDALERVPTRRRGLLDALKCERPEFYTQVG